MNTAAQYRALEMRIQQWADEAKANVDAASEDTERCYRRGQMDVALHLLAFIEGMENPEGE